MSLPNYIRNNMETLLQEWESSAKIIAPGLKKTRKTALRDHAEEMLKFIADDIRKPQSSVEKAQKSTGILKNMATITGAESHGAERMELGLSLLEVISEYRALRASVTRLWGEHQGGFKQKDIQDLVRFNEAMDQLLGEAVSGYSKRKEQETRLFEAMLSSTPDPSSIFDLEGRFMYVNDAMTELLEKPRREILGKTLFEAETPSATDVFEKIKIIAQTGKDSRLELSHRLSSGRELIYDCYFVAIRDERNRMEAVAKISRDITERKATEHQVWRNANFDQLTGIPNRRLYQDRLDQSLKHADRTGCPFALLFIDLDRFKEVNDQIGHGLGDMLLKQAAQRIMACVREVDTVARLGGDEFTVILNDIPDPRKARIIARSLLAELARPFKLNNQTAHISGSIGLTLHPRDGRTAEQLIRNADQAMYAAKQAGGNRLRLYSSSMKQVESEHTRIVKELSRAIEQGQFTVYFQPVVDLSSGVISHAEALIRWQHPERGLLSPVTFLKTAEQTGMIDAINKLVLTEAAACSRYWGQGLNRIFPVSINESPISFFTRGTISDWASQFSTIDLTGSRIIIEITEAALANASATSADLLRDLAKYGIALAIDDFGMGRFSMAALKDCGVDYLKMDQSIVCDMQEDSNKEDIADAIISMAHSIQIGVIAEGVENRRQSQWLKRAGCDLAQGYLYSEPLSQNAFQALLKRHRPTDGDTFSR